MLISLAAKPFSISPRMQALLCISSVIAANSGFETCFQRPGLFKKVACSILRVRRSVEPMHHTNSSIYKVSFAVARTARRSVSLSLSVRWMFLGAVTVAPVFNYPLLTVPEYGLLLVPRNPVRCERSPRRAPRPCMVLGSASVCCSAAWQLDRLRGFVAGATRSTHLCIEALCFWVVAVSTLHLWPYTSFMFTSTSSCTTTSSFPLTIQDEWTAVLNGGFERESCWRTKKNC